MAVIVFTRKEINALKTMVEMYIEAVEQGDDLAPGQKEAELNEKNTILTKLTVAKDRQHS